MSSPTADGRDLEDRLRAVLQAEADGLVFDTPQHFEPAPSPGPANGSGRWPWSPRLTLAVAGAGTAAAAILLALLLQDDVYDTATVEDPPGGEAPTSDIPAVAGASGSRWFMLDLAGVTPTYVDIEPRWGGEPGLQAFRTEASFDGPIVYLESVPAGEGFGFGQDNPSAEEVTVQGNRAYLSEDPDGAVSLGWPGEDDGGFYITATHIAANEVLAFAEGLRPRSGGEGWDATVLPEGLTELDLGNMSSAENEYAEWRYELPDQGYYDLHVYSGGAAVFENWALEKIASYENIQAISVGSRPGLLIEEDDSIEGDESTVVWRPTDDSVGILQTSEDPLTSLEALRPVSEQDWLDHLPPDVRP